MSYNNLGKPNHHLEINFKANIQSTLKRTKIFSQSTLVDFDYEPGNLFQGGIVNGVNNAARYDD